MNSVSLYTIGFTKKSAEVFFEKILSAGVARVLDVRLNNSSQLAGFAKRDDLKYFLGKIGKVDYQYLPELAPTKQLLDEYKKHNGEWRVYEAGYLELIEKREIEKNIPKSIIDGGCFLCSEDEPTYCHRRLVAEYLGRKWGGISVTHLF